MAYHSSGGQPGTCIVLVHIVLVRSNAAKGLVSRSLLGLPRTLLDGTNRTGPFNKGPDPTHDFGYCGEVGPYLPQLRRGFTLRPLAPRFCPLKLLSNSIHPVFPCQRTTVCLHVAHRDRIHTNGNEPYRRASQPLLNLQGPHFKSRWQPAIIRDPFESRCPTTPPAPWKSQPTTKTARMTRVLNHVRAGGGRRCASEYYNFPYKRGQRTLRLV